MVERIEGSDESSYVVEDRQYVCDKAFLSPKRLSQNNFLLKMQYRKNLGNQSLDMAKVKCNICAWIVVGKCIQNQHLNTENSKSSKNDMNYTWMHDLQCTKW